MAVPDSGWLDKIERAPPGVLLSIGVGTGAGWFLVLGQPVWQQAAFAACCLTATTLLVVKVWHTFWRRVERRRANRLKRRFDELSEKQQNLLQDVFDRGSRVFEVSIDVSTLRWFEELITWNYVKLDHIPENRSLHLPFNVTEQGWQELERNMSGRA